MRNKITLFLCVSFITALNASFTTPQKTSQQKLITPGAPRKIRIYGTTNSIQFTTNVCRKLNFDDNNINIVSSKNSMKSKL